MSINNYGVEIKLKSDFLIIKETLERIGIANRETNVITPSCYILHRRGKYYIMHFKELLAIDGFRKDVNDSDISRRNSIATLLENWDMIEILDSGIYQEVLKEQIFVLAFSEKKNYTTNHKYRMSKSKK